MVFDKLHEHRFYCKFKKCSFFRTTTIFLSFDVTLEGLKISDTKVKSLPDWPLPMTIKKVQSFLRFVQYFWKFIKSFSALAKLLTKLTWKNSPFVWGDDQLHAFKVLEDHLCTAPVLEIYDGHADTMVELHTDASVKALGAVLFQQRSGQTSFHPAAYNSC